MIWQGRSAACTGAVALSGVPLHTLSSGARHVTCHSAVPKKGDAMQCNKMVELNARKIATSCSVPAYDDLGRSPCHPAPSSEHLGLLLYSFLCKTAAKVNPKKKHCHIPTLPRCLETLQYNVNLRALYTVFLGARHVT